MHFKLKSMALTAVAILAVGAARADVLLGASVTEFGFHVTDLRPDDGVAPSLKLGIASYTFSIAASEGPYAIRDNRMVSSFVSKGGLFHENNAVTRTATAARSEAGFGISGAFADHSFEWFLRGHAANTRGDPLQASSLNLEGVSGQPGFYLGMTVAPYTQVVWSGKFTLEAAQTLGKRGARVEQSNLSGSVALLDENREILGGLGRFTNLGRGAVDSQRDVYDIDITFANDGAGPRQLSLEGVMSGAAQSFHPVPEPGTTWLMLCGLGALAGVAGRTRRRAG